jgi:hypothetical protein
MGGSVRFGRRWARGGAAVDALRQQAFVHAVSENIGNLYTTPASSSQSTLHYQLDQQRVLQLVLVVTCLTLHFVMAESMTLCEM